MSTVLGGPMGRGSRAFYRTMWTLSYLMAKVLFRVRIVHKERVPADRPFVLAPIHRSYLDTPVGGMVTTRQLRFLGKESIWNSRLGGRLVALLGGFPVERGSAEKEKARSRKPALAVTGPISIKRLSPIRAPISGATDWTRLTERARIRA